MGSLKALFLPLIALCFLQSTLSAIQCPPAGAIPPCTCNLTDKTITCQGGDEDVALNPIFEQIIRSNPDSNDRKFKSISLKKLNIRSLQKNVFGDMVFDVINIENCIHLHQIDKEAFIQVSARQFNVNDSPMIDNGNNQTTTDFFHAINILKNLEVLTLYGTDLAKVPANAFKDNLNKKLTEIRIVGFGSAKESPLKTVESKAFSTLSLLRIIDLSLNEINRIEPDAFQFETKSTKDLTVYLQGNKLTTDSFANQAFDGIQRQLILNLGVPGGNNNCNNNLDSLKESVFNNYFTTGDKNKLIFGGCEIVCDCDLKYIIDRRAELFTQLSNATCLETKKEIWYASSRHWRKCQK